MGDKEQTIHLGEVLDSSDPGDAVGSRFRYQYAYAAFNALRCVTTPEKVRSVICENHEDFIIEEASGKYVAVQVKTRELRLDPLRLTDSPVLKALAKFCRLDANYPGQIDRFDFSTNHRFWNDKESHQNLPWVVNQLQEKPTVKGLRATSEKRIAVQKVAAQAELNQEDAAKTLSRVLLNARDEPITNIERTLLAAIWELGTVSDWTYPKLLLLANDLIALAQNASSLGLGKGQADLYAAGGGFNQALAASTLAGKKLDGEAVQRAISERADNADEPLILDGLLGVGDLPVDLRKMVQKLAAGGVQKVRIDHLEDLVRSFQSLELRWARKHSLARARTQRQDILARVMTDCVEAVAAAEGAPEPYGANMYTDLLQKLRERADREDGKLHGCTPEHLLGAAGLLTEQCKVWWSPRFSLMEEGGE
ncbi:dsDNA nuclease domain-containing protein [Maricaulis sp.]|uniref:dsDNA nuclease domain-containing protein n=1 Tax=Maricaulis sp. TaxID=1486257 RepID=UPI003297F44B